MATKKQQAHDHDHDDHDHDHDHEHEELTDEEMAEAEADVARMGEALAALDDEALREGLAGMTEKTRGELAALLNLPRATMHLGDALVPLVRRKLRGASADRQLQATFAIVERVNDATIAALGPRSEDPTRADLEEVLPGVIEQHNTQLVTAMLAGYAASDAKCRPVMRELLADDERFTIGPPIEVEAQPSTSVAAAPEVVDEAALKAKREARRAAKEAKRAAEQRAKEARAAGEAKRRAAVHASRRKKG